jgi:hypothetical protein
LFLFQQYYHKTKKNHFFFKFLSKKKEAFLTSTDVNEWEPIPLILETSEYRQYCSIKKIAHVIYLESSWISDLSQSINQAHYKNNAIKEVIPTQTCRWNKKTWKCAGFFVLQSHESKPTRYGGRSSKIILSMILWEPIVTRKDQYNLFSVTPIGLISSVVWLPLLHSLCCEKKDHRIRSCSLCY